MNNDLSNNHSSVSSNRYIANRKYPQLNKYIQESYIKDKNKGMLDIQSKGNRTISLTQTMIKGLRTKKNY